MKNLVFKFLFKLRWLRPDTSLWVLTYAHPKMPKTQPPKWEYFFSEVQAINRRQEILRQNKDTATLLQKYTGVDTRGPIKAERLYGRPKTG